MSNIDSPAALKRGAEKRYQFLGKVGNVVSYSSIAVAPEGLHRRVPYLVALVDFDGNRAAMPLVDVEAEFVKTGMRVMGVLRRMREPQAKGVIVYGVKCVPIGITE